MVIMVIVVGIGTSAVGINTTGLLYSLKLNQILQYILQFLISKVKETRSGIETGDYFVIKNTFIGDGSYWN